MRNTALKSHKTIVALAIFFALSTGCDSFKHGYRVCDRSTNECYEVTAKFKDKGDCITHLERSSHLCMGGEHLNEIKPGDPVCRRSAGSSAFGECVEL